MIDKEKYKFLLEDTNNVDNSKMGNLTYIHLKGTIQERLDIKVSKLSILQELIYISSLEDDEIRKENYSKATLFRERRNYLLSNPDEIYKNRILKTRELKIKRIKNI